MFNGRTRRYTCIISLFYFLLCLYHWSSINMYKLLNLWSTVFIKLSHIKHHFKSLKCISQKISVIWSCLSRSMKQHSRILFQMKKKIERKLKPQCTIVSTFEMINGYYLIHDLLDVWRIIEGHQNVCGKFGNTKQTNMHVHCVLGCLVKLGDILLSKNIVCIVTPGYIKGLFIPDHRHCLKL